MGSYNEVLVGRGKNRADALANAWDEYVYQNGHRCSLRKTESARKLRDVPPVKPHVEVRKEPGYNLRGYRQMQEVAYHSMREDPAAPRSEWLEEWEFEVWVHS